MKTENECVKTQIREILNKTELCAEAMLSEIGELIGEAEETQEKPSAKVYDVGVYESLSRSYSVKANSREEAEEYIDNLYRTGEIVLDADDYVDDSGKVEAWDERDADEVISGIDYDLTKGSEVAE